MKLMIEHEGRLALVCDLDAELDLDVDNVVISHFEAERICEDVEAIINQVKKGEFYVGD